MARNGGAPGTKLYIGGLEKDTNENELQEAFDKFGTVTELWISRDRPGFGFVTFESADCADEAVAQLNGQTVAGVKVRVEVAGQKREGGSRGGFRGGRGYGDGGRGGSRGGGGGCYNCGGFGHFSRECPNGGGGGGSYGGGFGGGRGRGGRRGGGGGGACYNCGESGHFSRECPQGGGGGGGRGGYSRGGF